MNRYTAICKTYGIPIAKNKNEFDCGGFCKEPLFGRADNIIKSDYPTYSGIMLEKYFKQQFAESLQYRAIGSWWEPKGSRSLSSVNLFQPDREAASGREVQTDGLTG